MPAITLEPRQKDPWYKPNIPDFSHTIFAHSLKLYLPLLACCIVFIVSIGCDIICAVMPPDTPAIRLQ